MSLSKKISREIHGLTGCLLQTALLDSFNYPRIITFSKNSEITVGEETGGLGFGGIPYSDIYHQVLNNKFFNFLLLDGGLITLQYLFHKNAIIKHRLCFWSSPTYASFQNEPDLYQEDNIYMDFLEPSLVPFPFRFDFSADENIASPIIHPKSHLTFSAFKNCRIPVCSPIGPTTFVKFILRNFYNTAYCQYEKEIVCDEFRFNKTIHRFESRIPHVSLD